MEKNIGTADRIIRIILGIALLAWAFMGDGEFVWLGWLGVIPLATALLNWCPAYSIIGIKTCPSNTDSE